MRIRNIFDPESGIRNEKTRIRDPVDKHHGSATLISAVYYATKKAHARRVRENMIVTKKLVVPRHLPLALVDLDLHLCLPVSRRAEHLDRKKV